MAVLTRGFWRNVVHVNYQIAPEVLHPYLPPRTEILLFQNKCFITLTALVYDQVKFKGLNIPLHREIPEVNLRFYVSAADGSKSKNGVVLLKRIIAKPLLAFAGQLLFQEQYAVMPISYFVRKQSTERLVKYFWKNNPPYGEWHSLSVKTSHSSIAFNEDDQVAFLTKPTLRFSGGRSMRTRVSEIEYKVTNVFEVDDYQLDVKFSVLFGGKFQFLSRQKPESVYLLEDSEVTVRSVGLL